MGIGTDKLGELYIQNSTTNETTFMGTANLEDVQFKIDKIDDETIHNISISPREMNISLDVGDIDIKGLKEYLGKAQTCTAMSNSITRKQAYYMAKLGFTIYPMRKSKSNRIQMKYNKKYGFRAIKNMKISDLKIDCDKQELHF